MSTCFNTLNYSSYRKISVCNIIELFDLQNAADYQIILSGVRGDAQTKRLSSQFIARFFTKFPNLANASLDALLDLCEDDDVNIRKQAIKVKYLIGQTLYQILLFQPYNFDGNRLIPIKHDLYRISLCYAVKARIFFPKLPMSYHNYYKLKTLQN